VPVSQTKGDRRCCSELLHISLVPHSLLCALSVVFAKGGCKKRSFPTYDSKSRAVRDFDLHRPCSVMWLNGPEYSGTG